jgi:hypothetical protein
MFKIWGSAAMAGSILCAAQTATGPPAAALEQQVQLTNNTRMAIVEIYLAQVGTERWQDDLLGNEILLPANSVILNFDGGTGYCRFDLKIVYDDGTAVIRRDINMCRMERFTISYR